MSDSKVPREPNGNLLPGAVLNPTGNNGHMKGWTLYGIRLQKWLGMPTEELMRLAKDKRKLSKLSTIDAICVKHVLNSLVGKFPLQERRELIDRIEGTPKQTIMHQGDANNPMYPTETKDVTDAAKAYQDAIRST